MKLGVVMLHANVDVGPAVSSYAVLFYRFRNSPTEADLRLLGSLSWPSPANQSCRDQPTLRLFPIKSGLCLPLLVPG